jgi:SOS response regulatory protein OraA/RecX
MATSRRSVAYNDDVISEVIKNLKSLDMPINYDLVSLACKTYNEVIIKLLNEGYIVDTGYAKQYIKKRGTNQVMTDNSYTYKIVSDINPDLKGRLMRENPESIRN